ncbi:MULTISPECIES: phage adaptor protein [unclassified Sphingomonas]|uniref:phage adaptor protein n=1 Tax=unclassified Sphingomonas TaxID=196159 RepID=UPI0006F22331|nr:MULTISPECIES: hypothetical protein [unclassified Sphingomonas]KQX18142.1 hypothetical protein ASD17_20945 [Sphingomonas sp. Root1294]KQY72697.1 hypothetical protein ASD39_18060 [Sphingomonas sp. Root50]KRB87677.1 hypothetical protein ASE22_23515 [Sphingomonas sp. Root720]
MALSTYFELVASLAVWLDGADLAGQEGTLVSLTEAEINARLADAIDRGRAVRPMAVRDTLTIDAEYVDFPSVSTDIILPISIEITSLDRPWEVLYASPESLVAMKYGVESERSSVSAFIAGDPPRYYTIVQGQLRFYPAPLDTSFTAEFTRYETLPALGEATSTNWLLSQHPNVYLYGALAQAELLGWNDSRMANLATLFVNAVDGMVARYPEPVSRTTLRTDLACFGRRGVDDYASFIGGTL